MREALRKLRPDRFEDIIAMVALYRPGPMDNIPTYINRKHGREEPDYLHPMLEPILQETYGVIIYQEQVMQIAQVWPATRSAKPTSCAAPWARRQGGDGEAGEPLRRRRGRERRRRGRRNTSSNGRQVRGLRLQQDPRRGLCAGRLPDRLYEGELPVEFLAASMTLDMGNTDKLDVPPEARELGITIVPPSVNARASNSLPTTARSSIRWRRSRTSARQAVEPIVAERAATAFHRLSRLRPRASIHALVNKRALESWPPPAPSMSSSSTARGLRQGRGHPGDRNAILERRDRGPERPIRAAAAAAVELRPRSLDPDGTAAAGIRGGRLLSLGPPARRLRGRSKARRPRPGRSS